ncbi:MAG: Bro-N domain-containing protein [Nanoarchaeota archaeon]
MDKKNKLVVFEDKKIRRIWHDDEWYFSIVDIIAVLTESDNPQIYWRVLKKRLKDEGNETVTKCNALKMSAPDGKMRLTDVGTTKEIFRLIQSIPSPKAEPFKQWLAQVGYERIEEIENPEIGQDRIKEYYEMKGYPKNWIDKRLRSITIRQELTEQWKNRDIKSEKEFAILTNEISKATFGKTIVEYKKFKQLKNKKQNLRDHMTDLELIFNMLGEKTTTEITKERNSQGFEECKNSAKEGGEVAGNARQDVEKRLGKSTISKENFLPKKKKKKKLK